MNTLTRFKRLLAPALLATFALAQAPSAGAQSPAELAPADTAFYLHLTEPDDWFADLTQGPLGQKMRQKIETREGSGDLLKALDMSLDQFMSAYFGGDLVVLSPGKDRDGVMFTKVAPADRAHAIDRLGLQRKADIAGHPAYVGEDGKGTIVMLDNWVAMCDRSAVEYLTDVLSQAPGSKRLADTERYAKWSAELPDQRTMTMLAFEGEDSQHALGVVRRGISLDATYLGISPDTDELMGMLGRTDLAEFGPLPAADTIGALSFNIVANAEMKQQLKGLDMMLGGKSFANDILPKLDPPTLIFLGSVAGEDVAPAVGVEVPVHGLALKMNDPSVAQDLTLLFDNTVLLANVAVTQIPADQIPQRTATYKDTAFKVAELGAPVAKALGFPELGPIQLVYGQVGDYYVFCTQEQFFKRCVDANAGGQAMRIDVEGPAHRLATTPVLAMTGRPDRFASLLGSWADMLADKGLPESIAGDRDKPLPLDDLRNAIKIMQQYSLIKMQVWSGEDGLVIGRAQLTAPL